MKSWVKGGLWGLGILILFRIFAFFVLLLSSSLNEVTRSYLVTGGFLAELYYNLFAIIGLARASPNVLFWLELILTLILFFIIGVFVGWLIGKWRKKE